MLHVERASGQYSDRLFRDFPERLRPTDLIVFNNTRVFPARLYGHRQGSRAQPVSPQNPAAQDFLRGRVEVLLTRQLSIEPNDWECLVRPGRKIGVGERLFFGVQNELQDELQAEVLARAEFGERRIRFLTVPSNEDFFAALDRIGHVPLPPYIARADSSRDRERYQTVYAKQGSAVAAPTAGLHFTPELLTRLRERKIETAEITLDVGLGTFEPVRTEKLEDHKIHAESYEVSKQAAEAIGRAQGANRPVLAIGTTAVRALEDAAEKAQGSDFVIREGRAEAEIFLYPGKPIRVVNQLLTNFHLPESSLLALVAALTGRENLLRAYRHAVESRYRFYSYGDCMLIR